MTAVGISTADLFRTGVCGAEGTAGGRPEDVVGLTSSGATLFACWLLIVLCTRSLPPPKRDRMWSTRFPTLNLACSGTGLGGGVLSSSPDNEPDDESDSLFLFIFFDEATQRPKGARCEVPEAGR